jgi:hypothetical protein
VQAWQSSCLLEHLPHLLRDDPRWQRRYCGIAQVCGEEPGARA